MKSKQQETRAVAHLPHLDIEILHARPWEGGYEQMMISLTAKPSFEVLDSFDPLRIWSRADAGCLGALARRHHCDTCGVACAHGAG
jgi:hypothetical protein